MEIERCIVRVRDIHRWALLSVQPGSPGGPACGRKSTHSAHRCFTGRNINRGGVAARTAASTVRVDDG
jgi:hypothetical protein